MNVWLLVLTLALVVVCDCSTDLPVVIEGEEIGTGAAPQEVSTEWVPVLRTVSSNNLYWAVRLTSHFDQDLHLLDSVFCAAREQRVPFGAPLAACPDCNFVDACPPPSLASLSPCCAQRWQTLARASALALGSGACGAQALGTLRRGLVLTAEASMPPKWLQVAEPPVVYALFLPADEAAAAYALRARVRPLYGGLDVAVSQLLLRPSELVPSADLLPVDAAGAALPVWRASSTALGDDLHVRICLDEQQPGSGFAASGSYFIQLSCLTVACSARLSVWLVDPPAATAAVSPPPPLTTAEQAFCLTHRCLLLTDSAPVRVSFVDAQPVFAVVRLAGPTLLDLSTMRDDTRTTCRLHATSNASDLAVDDPMWRVDDINSQQTLSLSFFDGGGGGDGSSISVHVKLLPRGRGSVLLAASTRAVFATVALGSLPPLNARFQLLGAAVMAFNGRPYRCANMSSPRCDEMFWPLASSDSQSLNAFIAPARPWPVVQDKWAVIQNLPIDFTLPELLAQRTPLNRSFTGFWVMFYSATDLRSGSPGTFPPDRRLLRLRPWLPVDLPSLTFAMSFQRRVVSAAGVCVRDPQPQPLAGYTPRCNASLYHANAQTLTNYLAKQRVLLSDWFSLTPPPIVPLPGEATVDYLNRMLKIPQLIDAVPAADWYNECAIHVLLDYMTGRNNHTIFVGQPFERCPDATNPCCNADLTAAGQCCLFNASMRNSSEPAVPRPPTSACLEHPIGSACLFDQAANLPRALGCDNGYCSLATMDNVANVLGVSGTVYNCPNFIFDQLLNEFGLLASECFYRPPYTATQLGSRCYNDDDCHDGAVCDRSLGQCLDSFDARLARQVQCIVDTRQRQGPLFQQIFNLAAMQLNYSAYDGLATCLADGGLSSPAVTQGTWHASLDPGCLDERTIHRPYLTRLFDFTAKATPFDQTDRRDMPGDACPLQSVHYPNFVDLASACDAAAPPVCNWHACAGCDVGACNATCASGDLTALAGCASPAASAQQEFCAVCVAGQRCQVIAGVTSPEQCAAQLACELPDGRVVACDSATALAAAEQCSERCPGGQSCWSYSYGGMGVCLAAGMGRDACLARQGSYDASGACYFASAHWPQQCPYEWVQCSAMSVADCRSFAASSALNAVAQCYVDERRACTRDECAALGGACSLEDSWLDMMPPPRPGLQSPSLAVDRYYRQQQPPSVFVSPPASNGSSTAVWGACVFDGADDYHYSNGQRYCKQWPDASAAVPRRTTSEGCADYRYRSAAACTAAGGVWLTPARSAAECATRSTSCVDPSYRPPETPGACALCQRDGVDKKPVWRNGTWVRVLPRRPQWLARRFGSAQQAVASDYLAGELNQTIQYIVQSLFVTQLAGSRIECLGGSLLNFYAQLLCNCDNNNDDGGSFDGVSGSACFSSLDRFSLSGAVCPDLQLAYALNPVKFTFAGGSFQPQPAYCLELAGKRESFLGHLNTLRPPSSLLEPVRPITAKSEWYSRLLAARTGDGKLRGYLVGDGISLRSQPVYLALENRTIDVPLSDVVNFELCFLVARPNLVVLPAAAAHRGRFDVAMLRDGVPVALGYTPRLSDLREVFQQPDAQMTPHSLLTYSFFTVCFDNVSFPADAGTSVVLLPVVVSDEADDQSLSTYSVCLFAVASACYGCCAALAAAMLVLTLVVQRARPNPSHLVVTGLLCFLVIRLIYFAFLAAGKIADWPPTLDFALLELPSFLLAATFVVMLVLWLRFLHGKPVGAATWLFIAAVDTLLLLLWMMFVLLFALLPVSDANDPFACGFATGTANYGFSRSQAQADVEVAGHSFIVSVSVLLACLFGYVARTFVRRVQNDGQSAASLFRFRRASSITTKPQQNAKIFQTLVVLALFFLVDSLFLLILYLFTSYYQSSWAVYVLLVVEVLPCTIVLYQLHPKWTLRPIYAGHRTTSTANRAQTTQIPTVAEPRSAFDLITTDQW